MKKTAIITAISLLGIVIASCTKSDIKPNINTIEVKSLKSVIIVSTSDTTLSITSLSGAISLPSRHLELTNLSSSDAVVKVNNVEFTIKGKQKWK